MRVKVRLFASLRELAGRPELLLELPEAATADDAWARLSAEHPGIAGRRAGLSVAVNRKYATFAARLEDGDEVVFVPPVSGG